MLLRNCNICGEEFLPSYRTQPNCSPKCSSEAKKRGALKRAKTGWYKKCLRFDCQNTFYVTKANSAKKYCSRTCEFTDRPNNPKIVKANQELRKNTPHTRKGTLNPNYRHGKRTGVRDRSAERKWYAALGDKCMAPRCPHFPGVYSLVLHHVCYEQEVRRSGGDIWDPSNSMTLCTSCHSSHHHSGRIISLLALSDENLDFAFSLMASRAYNYLTRHYEGKDPRVDLALENYSVRK